VIASARLKPSRYVVPLQPGFMPSTLARTIGPTQATAMVVGTIVGSSIFVQPSEVSRAVPTFSGMLLVRCGNAARLLGLEERVGQ